jgi:hypothetical protein
MAKVPQIAQLASDRLTAVVQRARPIARGVALLATSCGGLAYLVGVLVFSGSWRYIWLFIGLLCFLPSYALWKAFSRLHRATRSISSLAGSLSSLVSDRPARDAMSQLAASREDPETAPLELAPLRAATESHRAQLVDLWQTITAVTSLPGLMAVGIIGSFGLLIFSVVAVVGALIVR